MSNMEWPANEYAIGSYIQSTVAEKYLDDLELKPNDNVLDIGCGDGGFSLKILEKIPQGSFVGIDASANMLDLAKKTTADFARVSFQQADAGQMDFSNQFDYVVSFWCLQWTQDIKQAFKGIYKALKNGGKFLTLFPSGDDALMGTYRAVKESGLFPQLDHFKTPVNYKQLDNLHVKLADIPFKQIKVDRKRQSILLPSLDFFRKFVNGIAFYEGQVPTEDIPKIKEAMVEVFDKECQERYQGKYYFNFSIYYVSGEK